MPWPTGDDGLTLKQRRFAVEYVRQNGNGTRAAEAAGYSGDEVALAVRGSENVRKRKVRMAINKLTRKHEISAERVLTRLDNLSVAAEEEGQYAVSVKAEELLGKSLGMWIDRSETLNVNVSGEHLEAMMARAQARRAAARGSGTPIPHDTQSIDATDHTSTQDVVIEGESQSDGQDDEGLTR